jgi:hypothetical protein
MNTQHTPGPWDYDYYDDHIALSSPKHPDDYFARVEFSPCVDTSPWDGDSPMTEDVANTKLIAVAPELLAVVQRLFLSVNGLSATFSAVNAEYACSHLRKELAETIREAQNAINKATT